jgi:hypothetical protein
VHTAGKGTNGHDTPSREGPASAEKTPLRLQLGADAIAAIRNHSLLTAKLAPLFVLLLFMVIVATAFHQVCLRRSISRQSAGGVLRCVVVHPFGHRTGHSNCDIFKVCTAGAAHQLA